MVEPPKPTLILVEPDAAGLARLYRMLTGEPATEDEMRALLDAEGSTREAWRCDSKTKSP